MTGVALVLNDDADRPFTQHGFYLSGDEGTVYIAYNNNAFSVWYDAVSLPVPRVTVTLVGPLAIVAFEVTSESNVDLQYSLAVYVDLYVDGDDRAPLRNLGYGFSAEGDNRPVYFLCNSHPLVVDADTYNPK
jgi:hypothetical protein